MITLPLKKFKIENIMRNNNRYVLFIKTLDLEINEQMEICNYTDTVKVSIDNLTEPTIQLRSISI